MEERGLRHSYFFTLIKFVLFLIIFCFLVELSREFLKECKSKEEFNLGVLYLSILSPFVFYTFISDLNNTYRKIQNFFFRTSFLSFLFPTLLIILGIGFFILPKVFDFSFNRNNFLFWGGAILTCHLIFIARETKGHNFTSFVNYLFILSILYTINLILFGLYLRVGFSIDLGKVISGGIKEGYLLIQNLFTQVSQ
jgi:hypothetical protein